VRERLEGGSRTFEDEEAIDAASSGTEVGGGRLLTSSGKCLSCTELLSVEVVTGVSGGSGRGGCGLDCLYGRKGSSGSSGSSLLLDGNNGVESDIEVEYEDGRVIIDECDSDGAG